MRGHISQGPVRQSDSSSEAERRFSRRRFTFLTAGSVALMATGVANRAGATSTDRHQINSNGVRLRSAPGTSSTVLASLSTGTIVRYLGEGGSANGYSWAKVEVESSGRVGYVAWNFLSPLSDGGGITIGDMVHVDAAGSGANLRSGPGTSYGVITVIQNGTTGTVTDGPQSGNGYTWFKINYGDVRGWMATSVIAYGGGSDRSYVKVASGPLRVRKSPGTSSTVLGTVPTGARGYTTTEMPQDANGYTWVNVQFDSGIRGWVASAFLTWI